MNPLKVIGIIYNLKQVLSAAFLVFFATPTRAQIIWIYFHSKIGATTDDFSHGRNAFSFLLVNIVLIALC
jgi:hypothetical protein